MLPGCGILEELAWAGIECREPSRDPALWSGLIVSNEVRICPSAEVDE